MTAQTGQENGNWYDFNTNLIYHSFTISSAPCEGQAWVRILAGYGQDASQHLRSLFARKNFPKSHLNP
jgi:hypothetical protein